MLKPEDYKLGLLVKWDSNQQIVKDFILNTNDGKRFKDQIGEVLSLLSWDTTNKYWMIWWPGLVEDSYWYCQYLSKVNDK